MNNNLENHSYFIYLYGLEFFLDLGIGSIVDNNKANIR